MGNTTHKKRNSGLDIVRSVAVFFVVSVHFFLYNGFYKQPVDTPQMFFAVAFRDLFYTCVPLFMILSGYLLSNKKLEKSYFKGIGRVIYVYSAASVIILLFQVYYLGAEKTFYDIIKAYFGFSAAPYAWYISMYIGLFLLIPFLNILYHGLESKRKKQALILIMLIITALPGMFNGKENLPSLIPGADFVLLPSWWVNIYPLTYYFIGAYIKEYQVKLPKIISACAVFTIMMIEAALVWMQSEGLTYKTTVDGYGNGFVVLLSLFLFLLLYDIDLKNSFLKNIFESISKLSLGIYLLSYIFDYMVYYQHLNINVPVITDRFKYYFVVVPLIFFSSLSLSAIVEAVYTLYQKVKKKLIKSPIEVAEDAVKSNETEEIKEEALIKN